MNRASQQFIALPFVDGCKSFEVFFWAKIVPVIEYVHSTCGDGIVISHVTEMLLVACGYQSSRLSHIGVFARVAFKLVDSAGVVTVRLL